MLFEKIAQFLKIFTVSDIKNTFVKFFIIFIILPLSLKYLYYKLTKFTIEITVKEKYKKYESSSTDSDNSFFVVDSNDNIFNVTNLFFKYDFNKLEDWNKLEPNKKYLVCGYGIEIAKLGFFKNIYEVKNI